MWAHSTLRLFYLHLYGYVKNYVYTILKSFYSKSPHLHLSNLSIEVPFNSFYLSSSIATLCASPFTPPDLCLILININLLPLMPILCKKLVKKAKCVIIILFPVYTF